MCGEFDFFTALQAFAVTAVVAFLGCVGYGFYEGLRNARRGSDGDR